MKSGMSVSIRVPDSQSLGPGPGVLSLLPRAVPREAALGLQLDQVVNNAKMFIWRKCVQAPAGEA